MPASVRTFGVIVGLTGTSLVAFGSVASAAPAPVTVTMAEPFQGGAIVVERTAGETTGQPDRWRMNQDIWLQNTGAATLVLDEITISYSGGSDPADITVGAATFNAIADDPMNLNQIPVGATSRLRVPEERVHAFPIADSVSVSITFVGFDPVVVTRDLAEYIGDGPLGSLAFPSAAKDLAPGEYWAHGTGHQLRDHHRNQFWERFAEDWGVVRWDGAAWTEFTDDPVLLGNSNWNDDYLIWGKGLYVSVPGEIVACANGHADDSFPSEDVAGVGDYGNFVWIDTGDTLVLVRPHPNGHDAGVDLPGRREPGVTEPEPSDAGARRSVRRPRRQLGQHVQLALARRRPTHRRRPGSPAALPQRPGRQQPGVRPEREPTAVERRRRRRGRRWRTRRPGSACSRCPIRERMSPARSWRRRIPSRPARN